MMGTESVCMLVACLQMRAHWILYTSGSSCLMCCVFGITFFFSLVVFICNTYSECAECLMGDNVCVILNTKFTEQNYTDTYTCLLCRYTTLHSYLSLVSSIHATNQRWQNKKKNQQQQQKQHSSSGEKKNRPKEKNFTSIACIHTTQKISFQQEWHQTKRQQPAIITKQKNIYYATYIKAWGEVRGDRFSHIHTHSFAFMK